MKEKSTNSLFLVLKGAAMGIAEVIPGVSGGTIAFITGIYERLINSIKSVDAEALKLLFGLKFKAFFQKIDGFFLVVLAVGMVLGIGFGVLGMGYLLDNYPAPVWAFFFGLIISSAIYIGKQVESWSPGSLIALLVGFAIAIGVTFVSPAEGTGNLLWVFLCGVIAISALILPGVSGSFILLLLGMYTVVRGAAENVMLNQDLSSLGIILAFMVGCAVGLISFARVMSFAFKNYRNQTLALLTGFMLGSLRKIWPWRNIESYLDKNTGEIVYIDAIAADLHEDIQILKEVNVLPESFTGDPQTTLTILAAIIGFAIIFLFQLFERKED